MKIDKKILKIVLEKSETGYSAYAPEHDGIYNAADTFEEVKDNLKDVIEYQIDYLEEIGANKLKNSSIEYCLDIKQFFEQYPMLNKSEFANYIGINSSMMRKISSVIISLSDSKAQLIQDGLHKLAKEFSRINFA